MRKLTAWVLLMGAIGLGLAFGIRVLDASAEVSQAIGCGFGGDDVERSDEESIIVNPPRPVDI